MNETIYDYIIIGSGFGASVSAMRLTEKGYSVCIIEKGKRWSANDFPKSNMEFKRYFWMPIFRFFGIQQLSFFKEVFILSGVGFGGGSLVYANTHMIPDDPFFTHKSWDKFGPWKPKLMPFYERAKKYLGTTKNPHLTTADFLLRECAKDYGKEETFKTVEVGINFNKNKENSDPYFDGNGPLRNSCQFCSACMIGCPHNAKNTLDKNYLYFAEKNGAKVICEEKVDKIQPQNSIYIVESKSSTGKFSGKHIFKAKGIILAAGVLGTLEILFKQKFLYRTMPNISDSLGSNIRTNSESLCGVTSSDTKLNDGIAISSVIHPDSETHIEIVKYPNGSNAMKFLSGLSIDNKNPWLRPILYFIKIVFRFDLFLKLISNKKWAENSIIFLVMQHIDSTMQMTYRKFPYFRLKMMNKKGKKVPAYIPQAMDIMKKYASKINGISQNALTEMLFNTANTAHILGGCPMSDEHSSGVISPNFQCHAYPNFYIVDASIIQGNLGVNPSLTITALAEYAMSHIPDKTTI